jgi:predicted naringenin-chalcone synthase
MVTLSGSGFAYPESCRQDELWSGFFAGHYASDRRGLAGRIFRNAGVRTRHAAVNPLVEDVSGWTTGQRMQRFLSEALPLGKAALSDALAVAGVPAADVGLLAVCTCTGYVTPGADVLLARDLGMAPDALRVAIGHMGCYAALPGLGVAMDYVRSRGRPAALLCLELTSLHIQPPSGDPDQMVAHALFSDAAAAAVMVPEVSGYELLDVAAVTDATTADHMTWEVTDLGFRMGLSARVPDVLDGHLGPFVKSLLGRHGLALSDVDGWAIHPGGPRILDVVGRRLNLTPEALAPSRRVLAEHGNCSSATVLMTISEVISERPDLVVALAFGPGLTLYGCLLRRR